MGCRIISLFFFLYFFCFQVVFSQQNSDKALELGQKAIKIMDEKHADESIVLLKQAHNLDPKNIIYPYEIACAQYIKHDYKAAIKKLKKILNHSDVIDKVYQLLGNCYDIIGKSHDAIDVYNLGLEKFPKSGCLYLGLGINELNKKNHEKALSFFEKGIYVEPNFASNYYFASKIYFRTSNKLYGLIYGEIFMNIERIGLRVEEISELLYVIYKNCITISDSIISVDFNKNILYGEPYLFNDTIKNITFNMTCKSLMLSSIGNIKKIDMNALDQIRFDFLKKYLSQEIYMKYPNFLYAYQYEIAAYDHFEAYNHWLLKKGSQNEFGNWYEKNKIKWDKFVEWFLQNPIEIDDKHRFYSRQYE
jgi:tetratricopeptide (TPR) repeat protein